MWCEEWLLCNLCIKRLSGGSTAAFLFQSIYQRCLHFLLSACVGACLCAFWMDGLSYAIVHALFASMAAIKCRTFSCALLWVDYKGIRTGRERRKQADYTVAVVQPKALLCSQEGSAHRWSIYQRMHHLEESPSSWPFWRKYRKKMLHPFPPGWDVRMNADVLPTTDSIHNYIPKTLMLRIVVCTQLLVH